MSAPKRIQRKRTKGFRLPPNTVCVTRPGPLGNPWVIVKDDSGERNGWWIHHQSANGLGGAFARTMREADDGMACHGDILIEAAVSR